VPLAISRNSSTFSLALRGGDIRPRRTLTRTIFRSKIVPRHRRPNRAVLPGSEALMTRVLQTEFVVERTEVDLDSDPPDYPAISCAWFKLDANEPSAINIVPGMVIAKSVQSLAPIIEDPTIDQIESFIGQSFQDLEYDGHQVFNFSSNEKLVDWFLEQTMVIEESPPRAEPIRKLIGAGSVMSIGAMVGYSIAPATYPILLFITIPAGMIVIGSAAGIAVGMQHGLHELVKAKFKEWTKKPPKKRGPAGRSVAS
jgi:hypothetical protein